MCGVVRVGSGVGIGGRLQATTKQAVRSTEALSGSVVRVGPEGDHKTTTRRQRSGRRTTGARASSPASRIQGVPPWQLELNKRKERRL